MAQFFVTEDGPIYAVLVDEEQNGRYKLANFNSAEHSRPPSVRLAAMKRLWQKMVAAYPRGDVDLVEIVPIDAGTVCGDQAPESMTRMELEAEVRRLRAKK